MTAAAGSGAVEPLLRELAPRVLAAVARRHRDFGAAEDAVQEALLAAATEWPRRGLPANPGGWLHRAALFRLTDRLRSEAARARRERAVVHLLPADERFAPPADAAFDAERDDSLALLLLCCHPSLTPASAIALTLRAVGGLATATIAKSFFVPEATMAQRIARAKRTIRDAGARFEPPGPAERPARVRAAAQVIYLLFNEGYAASEGERLDRVDIAEEAIRLARRLDADAGDGETAGLLALCLLTHARRAARTGPGGELVPLDEQDRSRWDRAAIAEGAELVDAALARGTAGPYLLQAAIARLHDEAPSTAATDWRAIATLYAALERLGDNPMASLSRAIAIAMVDGPAAGLARLDELAVDPRLAGSHRLDAVRGHLLERAGDAAGAIACLRRAAEATTNLPEQRFLVARAARLARELGLAK